MIKFVIRNTHTTKTAVHAHQVYGFDLVCKYWDYREELTINQKNEEQISSISNRVMLLCAVGG